MEFFDLMRHRYIRSGDTLSLYLSSGGFISCNVTVEGWGKYAAVRVGQGAIRRDQIRKDKNGHWFYRYDE